MEFIYPVYVFNYNCSSRFTSAGSQAVRPTHRLGPVAVLGPLFWTSPSIEPLSWTPGATTVGNTVLLPSVGLLRGWSSVGKTFSGALPYLSVHANCIWTLAYIIIYFKCRKILKNSKNRMEMAKNSEKNSKNSRENCRVLPWLGKCSHG